MLSVLWPQGISAARIYILFCMCALCMDFTPASYMYKFVSYFLFLVLLICPFFFSHRRRNSNAFLALLDDKIRTQCNSSMCYFCNVAIRIQYHCHFKWVYPNHYCKILYEIQNARKRTNALISKVAKFDLMDISYWFLYRFMWII